MAAERGQGSAPDAAGRAGGRTRAARIASAALVVALAAVLWATRLGWPQPIGEPELDPSWQEAKGVELLRGMQVGVDTVFTYGPLGYFHTSPYVPELYAWKVYGWELGLRTLLCALIAAAAFRQRSSLERVALMIAAVLPLAGEEVWYLLSLLAAATWLAARPERRLALQALAAAAISLVALVKFTYFLLAVACAAAVVAAFQVRSRRRALEYAGLQAGTFLAAWIAAGQSPANLGRWVTTSLEIVRGYNEAMSIYGPAREVRLALATAALAGLAIAARVWRGRRDAGTLAAAALAVATLYLGYKAGFTRHGTNAVTFFGIAAVVAWFVPEPESARTRAERAVDRAGLALRLATAGVAIAGHGLVSGYFPGQPSRYLSDVRYQLEDAVGRLASPSEQRRGLETWRSGWTKYLALPKVRARVGDATVDCFYHTQSIVFRNGLRWHPRPVFQSYSAYTPELARANASFYAGPRAPRFVLFRSETTDGRLPSMEDAGALAELLRCYEPALAEHEFVLFERRPEAEIAARPARGEVVLEREAAFGERVDLSSVDGRCLQVAIDARSTWLGELWTSAVKARRLFVELEIDDGRRETFRLIPGMTRDGVIVGPYLDSHDSWIGWIAGEPTHRAVALTVRCEPDGLSHWRPEVGIRVLRADHLVPTVGEVRARELRCAMFETLPDQVYSRSGLRQVSNRLRTALVVHAPGFVRYDLEAGLYRVTGKFGIDPQAVSARCTDGAIFQVLVLGENDAIDKVFEKALDPVANPDDRRLQPLDVEVELPAPAKLFLRTLTGPDNDASCDWTEWTEVRVERVERRT